MGAETFAGMATCLPGSWPGDGGVGLPSRFAPGRPGRRPEEDLRRVKTALASGEFELHFQPRVNMCTGAILGAEALIRWRHPERGLLAPANFLPLIEGSPLVVELGEWVIDRALREMEGWREEGIELPVSINVDALQLQQAQFVERLTGLLAAYPGIPASRLEIEVLESRALEDVAQVSAVIRACGRLGITFALDDFGTGYKPNSPKRDRSASTGRSS